MGGAEIFVKFPASTELRVIRSFLEFRRDCALATQIMAEFDVTSNVRWEMLL